MVKRKTLLVWGLWTGRLAVSGATLGWMGFIFYLSSLSQAEAPALGVAGYLLVGCAAKLCCPHSALRSFGCLGPGEHLGMEARLPVPLGFGCHYICRSIWDI